MKKHYPETATSGQFWRSTLTDMDSRVRVARGIAKNETVASIQAFQTLKRRGHPDEPPPLASDGWGGIDEALLEVYGHAPPYQGRGRPPTRKRPGPNWQYVQFIKRRDKHGRLIGVEPRVVFGEAAEVLALFGQSTAYAERHHLSATSMVVWSARP